MKNLSPKIYSSIILLFCFFNIIKAQGDYVGTGLKYEDFIYKKNIKTSIAYNTADETSYPLANLLDAESITFMFDDLDGYPKDYGYEIILCEYDWTPADVLVSQFTGGNAEGLISNITYSACNFSKYIHYELVIPNQDVQLTKSGNYLLKVYEDGDKKNLVLTKRFMFFETLCNVAASTIRTIDVERRMTAQEIKFIISSEQKAITAQLNNFHVAVMQNQQWDTWRANFEPTFIRMDEMEYSYKENNIFPGNNEFRNLYLKSIYIKNNNIESITLETPVKVELMMDGLRSKKGYELWPDINGNRLIRNDLAYTSGTESDYVKVHFKLKAEPSKSGPIYLYGALCDYNFNEECKLTYNSALGIHETHLFLKQGYYNYSYVIYDKNGLAKFNETEGEHWETENKYLILVYQKSMTDIHHRLIGTSVIYSNK